MAKQAGIRDSFASATDTRFSPPGESSPLKPSRQMLDQEMRQAAEEFERPVHGLLLSGVSAGLGVGVSFFLMAVIITLSSDDTPRLLVEVLMANAFAVGFIMVILGRMDLFTEFTTIAILPVLARQASFAALVKLWTLVYVGNIAGAVAFAALVVAIGPELGVISQSAISEIAENLVVHPWWVILLSASLAGWMMGVLSWLITGGRETTSQIVFIWVTTAAIGLGHLHHAITGAAEVSAAVLIGATSWDRFVHFLAWTTIGNALGGILFAASVVYSLHMRHKEAPESVRPSAKQ